MKDINNVENGLWLPMDRRFYVNKTQYVDRLSAIGKALAACKLLLSL